MATTYLQIGSWDRKPHAVKFIPVNESLGQKRSLFLVPLHMRANVGGSGNACRKRSKKAEQLASEVDWSVNNE